MQSRPWEYYCTVYRSTRVFLRPALLEVMMDLSKCRKEVLDFYVDNFNLPYGMGSVYPDFQGKRRLLYNTYALGFKKTNNQEDEKLLKTLIRAAQLTPLQIIKEIKYVLYIRSIEFTETKDTIECSVRLGLEG